MACAHYQGSGESSEYADSGTRIHAAFASILKGENPMESSAGLHGDEFVDALWAGEYLIKYYGKPTGIEERLAYLDDNLVEVYFGTCDAYYAPEQEKPLTIADLKTGQRRDYNMQMSAYALPLMDRYGVDIATILILYSKERIVDAYAISRKYAEQSLSFVRDQIALANIGAPPTPCDYCGWCAHKADCPALNSITTGLIKRDLLTTELAEVTHPDQLGELKRLVEYARTQLDAIEDHIKRQAHAGTIPTGYRMGTRAGAVEITDINGAFNVCDMTESEFMAACKVSFPQLVKQYAKRHSMTESAAREELETRLNGYAERKPDTQYLMKAKKEIA